MSDFWWRNGLSADIRGFPLQKSTASGISGLEAKSGDINDIYNGHFT